MKNIRTVLFFIITAFYTAGLFAGSIGQVRTENQEEMYSYLEQSVAEYDADTADTVKSIAADNLKFFAAVILCGFFRLGIPCLCAAAAVKGFFSGFAITAVLRFYGMKGLIFCCANLFSAMLVIPSVALFGGVCAHSLISRRQAFLKHRLIAISALTLVFIADTLMRGLLSPVFMRLAAGIVL